jgi:serine/threonine-protein kinase
MGAVLGAHRREDGLKLAIKVLLPDAQSSPEAVRRFLLEGRTCQRIRSSHIAAVYEVGTTENDQPFLVMELLDGLDLGAVVRSRGALTVSEAVDYVTQACEAIHEAHVLGIVHRDLKPGNLYLTFDPSGQPHVKVLDFGISKVTKGEDLAVKTATSFSFGTPVYMSPEQVRSTTNVDARSDVWALAVILYELLAGVPPFEADSLPALSLKIAIDPPTPLGRYTSAVPLELERTILRCLEKDPAKRLQNVVALVRHIVPFGPPSARALLVEMERNSGEVGSSTIALRSTDGSSLQAAPTHSVPFAPDTSAPWNTQSPPPPSPSRMGAFAAVGLALAGVLVLAGVAGGLLLSRQTSPGSSPVPPPAASPSLPPPLAEPVTPPATTTPPPAVGIVAPTPPKGGAKVVRGKSKKTNYDER